MNNVLKRQQPDTRAEKQHKATKLSSTKLENLAPGGELRLAPKQ